MGAPNWFLALPLPPRARWLEAAASAPPELRRFARDDLHLTLAFLGPCGEQAALQAWGRLNALRSPPIPISAGGWRALGPPQRPSAYGLTLSQGHQPLCDLMQRWEFQALEATGLPPPARTPLPHVTLLRPRRRDAIRWIEPMRAWMERAPRPQGTVLLEELALWTWDPLRRQRLFRTVLRRPLT